MVDEILRAFLLRGPLYCLGLGATRFGCDVALAAINAREKDSIPDRLSVSVIGAQLLI